jgi:hypothetical protein
MICQVGVKETRRRLILNFSTWLQESFSMMKVFGLLCVGLSAVAFASGCGGESKEVPKLPAGTDMSKPAGHDPAANAPPTGGPPAGTVRGDGKPLDAAPGEDKK